jgi:hypothetical protein
VAVLTWGSCCRDVRGALRTTGARTSSTGRCSRPHRGTRRCSSRSGLVIIPSPRLYWAPVVPSGLR